MTEKIPFAKRENWKPGTMIYPLPAVLVSCGTEPEHYNIITVSWTGTICTNPPMCYISVRPDRYSHGIISREGEFVINLTTEKIAKETDWCGVRSGKDHDKFGHTGLTPIPSHVVITPSIAECPVCIECKVRQVLPLGSHDMFIADVVNVSVDPQYIKEDGKLDLEKAGMLVYNHGEYFSLGKKLGFFGWSVRKRKNIAREKDRG